MPQVPERLNGAMRGILRHSVSGISDVDPHGTIGGHPACIATTGATDKKSNVANFLEAQWLRGKALPRGSHGDLHGRRHRTTATIHRMLFRKEATL